jgi:pimeloyl-ACP methyl ester carboxylesterase
VFEYTSPNGDFAILLPPEVPTYRGVFVVGPGAEDDTRLIADRVFDNVGVFDDPGFQAYRARILALAEEHGLAVAGARLPSPDVTSLDRLENLPTALGEFADESGHPELTQAPLVFDGYSAGGCFAYAFTRRHPERVIGFWTQKGGCHDGRDGGAAKQVPGFLIIGGADLERRCLNLTELFENNRPAGALWALAVQPGAGHERMLDFDLLFSWMDTVIEQRLPEMPGALLRPISEESGWLGNPEMAAVGFFEDYDGDRAQASWLPSAEAAQRWSAFVSPGRAIGCPTEDPDDPSISAGMPWSELGI